MVKAREKFLGIQAIRWKATILVLTKS